MKNMYLSILSVFFVFIATSLLLPSHAVAGKRSCSDLEIVGAKNYASYSLPEVGKNVTHSFYVGKRKYSLSIFLEQMAWVFLVRDDLGTKARIPFAVLDYDEKTKWDVEKSINFINLHIFQHDFDFDGVNELIVGLEIKRKCHDLNEVGFSIFNTKGEKIVPIRFRTQSDELEYASIISTESRLSGFGVSRVEVKGNFLKLDRKHRGFFFKYFVDRHGITVEHNY